MLIIFFFRDLKPENILLDSQVCRLLSINVETLNFDQNTWNYFLHTKSEKAPCVSKAFYSISDSLGV